MPDTLTPLTKTPIWGLDRPRNVPATVRAAAEHLERFVVLRFLDAAARDAAFTGTATSPAPPLVVGTVCHLETPAPGVLQRWNGAAWVPLVDRRGPALSWSAKSTDGGNNTNATTAGYTDLLTGAAALSLDVPAPASGAVLVSLGAFGFYSAGTGPFQGYVGLRRAQLDAAGAVIAATVKEPTDDLTGVWRFSGIDQGATVSRSYVERDLMAGVTYRYTLVTKNTAGSSPNLRVDDRRIDIVEIV